MSKSPNDVKKLAKDAKIEIIDLRFVDLPGVWQHFSLPARELSDDMFTDGLGFDGSSIRGYQQIQESDMLLFPDPETAFVDPVLQVPTLSMICSVKDPVTGERYTRDPRHIAQKAEAYLKSSGIADISYWGPEAEFYIFDDVRYDQSAQAGYYHIDSIEGVWNTGRQEGPNLGYKLRHKEGYFPCPPADQFQDLRSEMILTLEKVGVPIEVHHHEVGTAGQAEIDMRFGPLTKLADSLMYYKYIIRNVARKHGKVVTFMPKPIFGDNGWGMHCHQSLWKGRDQPLLGREGIRPDQPDGLPLHGGLLKHWPVRALLALRGADDQFLSPAGSGYEMPVNLVYSQRNWSAAGRIPIYSKSPSRSGSSSAAPTRPATRTSPSPPCSWPAWTACRTRSTPATRSTRTSTTSSPRRPRRSRALPARWAKCSTCWNTTMSSCSRETCSPRTSLKPASPIGASASRRR